LALAQLLKSRVSNCTDSIGFVAITDVYERMMGVPDFARKLSRASFFSNTPLAHELRDGRREKVDAKDGSVIHIGDTAITTRGVIFLVANIVYGKKGQVAVLAQAFQPEEGRQLTLAHAVTVISPDDIEGLISVNEGQTSVGWFCTEEVDELGNRKRWKRGSLAHSFMTATRIDGTKANFCRVFVDSFESRSSRPYSLSSVMFSLIDLDFSTQRKEEFIFPSAYLPPGCCFYASLESIRQALTRLSAGIQMFNAHSRYVERNTP
jgi:hypothetical protein